MPNWAIVIGVDKYWQPAACLRGAVRDALEMRKWLLDPAGGDVPAANLTLILTPDRTQPESGVRFLAADHNQIVLAIERMLDRSGGQGERFFFHFSGHGLSQRINLSNQSAIVTADFSDLLTTNSLTVASLFELFQGTQFKEQYFFIDACRNLAFDTEKRLGQYPNPRIPVPPVSPQFVMYATQPGVKAIEVRQPGNERGAFTRSLLDGLRGAGSAKRWDPQTGEYVVRWDSLFEYVESTVKALKLMASAQPDAPLIQEPRQYGERGSLDPIFGRFAEVTFPKELLEIDLDPGRVKDQARVVVGEMVRTAFQDGPPVAGLPLKVDLPPRTYAVTADAPGYRMRQRLVVIDLYRPEQVTVELIAMPPPSPTAASRDMHAHELPADAAADAGIQVVLPAPPPPPGTITISSSDELAQLELADVAGRLIQTGRGQIFATGQPPGFYRARLVSPEGVATERLIELSPGPGLPSIKLDAPSPMSEAMHWAIKTGQFERQRDGTVEPSESVGHAAFLKLSTVLALAAGASMEGEQANYGHKLRRLQIPPFQSRADATSGVMLLLGNEHLDPESWAHTEIRWWPLRYEAPVGGAKPEHLPEMPAVAHASLPLDPGSYWLWLRLAEHEDLVMPATVLPGRVTLIVVTRETDSSIEVHQYQPLVDLAASSVGAVPEDSKSRDPFFRASRFAAMRRIELMQRSIMHGRVTPTLPDIDMLLWDKWVDPVAGCLGGYLAVRMGRTQDLEIATRNLVRYFGELPDSHILHAVYLEAKGDIDSARDAFHQALERGLPIYRDGLVLLGAAIARLGVFHPRKELVTELLSAVPPGALWSASPEARVTVSAGAVG